MFVEPVALDVVPTYARIAQAVIDTVAKRVGRAVPDVDKVLTGSFRQMEQRQPALAAFVAYELSELLSPALQSVAYRLCVLVFGAFEEAFGSRVERIELSDINRALSRLVADSELRSVWVPGNTYSEDAIAVGQPALVACLRAEVERAVASQPELDWDNLDRFYESLLAMVVVMTQAVAPNGEARERLFA
jgi:alpha-galactosidase